MIELRLWQHADDARGARPPTGGGDIWISARPVDGRWDALGTIAFPLDLKGGGPVRHGFHLYRDIAIAEGVEIRVWQRYTAPELFYVRVCGTPCLKFGVPLAEIDPRGEVPWWERWSWQKPGWTPLGMIPLLLDDGYSPGGQYRYGDLTVAVPLGNPGLAADREHLLALRDALAGTAMLNWSADSVTAEWEGVTLAGTPPRVTGLDLSNRGLTGSVWGWLGNLSELAVLRLDGNRLTSIVPSKLGALTNLTHVYLAGNALEGCLPPPLRTVAQHDLDRVDLPDCDPPIRLAGPRSSDETSLGAFDHLDLRTSGGSYYWRSRLGPSPVFDLPPGIEMRVVTLRPAYEDEASLEGP